MLERWILLGWPLLLLWAALFAGDYALTLQGARLYRRRAQDILRFEGSYELTPAYQADVDAGRWVSRRFLLAWAASTAVLGLLWWISVHGLGAPEWFAFGLGAVVLRELPVYTRHLQNIAFFRNIDQLRVAPGSRIEYPRSLIYRLSVADLAVATVSFLALAALLGSAFLFGGAVGCAVAGLQHFLWARRAGRSQPPTAGA